MLLTPLWDRASGISGSKLQTRKFTKFQILDAVRSKHLAASPLAPCTWTDEYPIWATTAKELGLPVRTDMPNEVLELMSLYPQPARTQGGGGVEYLPARRQKEA